MFCNKCGAEIPEGAKFCQVCGSAINDKGGQDAAPAVQEANQEPAPIQSNGDVNNSANNIGENYLNPQSIPQTKKGHTGCIVAIIIVVVFISLLVLLSQCFGGKTTTKTTHGNNENTKVADENEPKKSSKKGMNYEITDTQFNYYTNSIDEIEYHAWVEITNTGDTNLLLKNCKFDFEDNDGHLLQTDNFLYECPKIIAPGEKGYFYNSLGSNYIQ